MNATRDRKALPQRPSQDSFGSNGSAYGQNQISPPRVNGGRPAPLQSLSQAPSGRVALEGYRTDIMNNFDSEKPRFNPMNATRPQSSMLLNVNDPIQVHLLVETALGDSKEFELLSQEEVDDLKKLCQTLQQRIDQTRQNLAIQSKYRDAAISMTKLYSPTRKNAGDAADPKKSRRSILGIKGHNSDHIDQADQERLASERRCEELAQELFSLEKRLMEPQRRLLEHTAGILQMTHKGPVKAPKSNAPDQPGIPGSPESMYTYSNARGSIEAINEDDMFDDRSLYRTFDRLDGLGLGGRPDSWDSKVRKPLPPQGPSKEQLAEAVKAKELLADQMQTIAKTEQKLEDLNTRLREVIISTDPKRGESYNRPPQSSSNDSAAKILAAQLEYLERGLEIIDSEQRQSADEKKASEVEKKASEAEKKAFEAEKKASEAAMEETIEELNREVRDLLLPFDNTLDLPPQLTGNSLKEQLHYFHSSLGAVESELQRAASVHSELKNELQRANSVKIKNVVQTDSLEKYEIVLEGLWDIIQSGEEDIRKRKLQRRQTRSAEGMVDEESDMSGDDALNMKVEDFTLQAFSAKVQWLYGQATSLKDQKKVLQRQIKQQRELNVKGDDKTKELTEDLEQNRAKVGTAEKKAKDLQTQLSNVEREAKDVKAQLQTAMAQLEKERSDGQTRSLEKSRKTEEEGVAVRDLEKQLQVRDDEIAKLEEDLQDLRDDQSMGNAESQAQLAEARGKVDTLTVALAQATKEKEAEQVKLAKAIQDKETEMENMNMEIARLQTEVTIARAELDGAYGSRAQRAAEVAANPAIMKEIETLTARNKSLSSEIETLRKTSGGGASSERVQQLQRELGETIEEFEIITKASIEWEKEREGLEREIDKLRDERESLEAKLSDEQVRWLGMGLKSPGSSEGQGVGAGSTSTMVLRNEFKKMMRDTRAENSKALRAEQAERRRVEDELRALKRQQGPGKSGLSQSMGA